MWTYSAMKCSQMGIGLLILLIFNFEQCVHADEANSVLVDGDLMIIALFSIHRKENSCKQIQEVAGLQRAEIALRTIEEINRNKKKTNSCTLGIYIRDTCESYTSTDSLERELTNLAHINSNRIVGLIGPATSEETEPYVRVFQQYHNRNLYVQIGYGATASKLLDRPKNHYSDYPRRNFDYNYSNFVRVVPSNADQVKAIMKFVKHFPNCSAINVINSDDEYGEDGVDEFKKQASLGDVCVNKYFTAKAGLKSQGYFEVLNNTANITQVVVCFCDGDILRDVLNATKELNMTRKFIFIATDRWAERDDVLKEFKAQADRNLFINIKSSKNYNIESINYTMIKEKTSSSIKNKWMEDFYRNRFNCALQAKNNSTTKLCNENENLRYSEIRDPKLPFVIESIKKIAELVENKRQGDCKLEVPKEDIYDPRSKKFGSHIGPFGVDPEFRQWNHWKYPYTHSYHYYDSDIHTDNNPLQRHFEIFYYQYENNKSKFVPVGTWENSGDIKWSNRSEWSLNITKFNINCRNNCTPGNHVTKDTCCWRCKACERNNYTVTGGEDNCIPCKVFLRANDNKTACEPKDEERIYLYETDAIICIFVSTFGILATLISAVIIYKHLEVPIIKYSTPELTIIIFSGMILAYSYAFLLVIKPNNIICTVIKFWTSVSLTLIYGPLLARVNRTSRAFTVTKLREPYLNKEYFTTKFLMKVFSYFLAAELIMIGVVDFIVFQEVQPADINPNHERKITFFCRKDETNQFNSRHLINVLLLVYSCVYALKAIKLPDNFYESKFIASSCASTIVIWIVYLLIFSISTATRTAQISLCLVLSASAFICLAGTTLPKLYIILWRPQKYEYFFKENQVQVDLFQADPVVTMDISFWEYLGVASRITPDIVDASELKITSETSAKSEIKNSSEAPAKSEIRSTSEAPVKSEIKSTSEDDAPPKYE